MRIYEREYNEELAIRSDDYIITIKEFSEWLEEGDRMEKFQRTLRFLEEERELYNVAFDYSIPVAMVKWFINRK